MLIRAVLLVTANRACVGYYEVSGVLRYAIDAKALPQLLEVLEQGLEWLQPQEIELLDGAWPRTSAASSGEPRTPLTAPTPPRLMPGTGKARSFRSMTPNGHSFASVSSQ